MLYNDTVQVIIVNGVTATGKTTLTRYIARELNYQTLIKDDIKETLVEHDSRQPNFHNWRYFEQKSLQLLYEAINEAIANNTNVIIESNFHITEQNELRKLLEKIIVKEIYCYAQGWIIIKRYILRKERGQRSPVHQDRVWYPQVFLMAIIPFLHKRWNPPMKFVDKRLEIDTTRPGKIDYKEIIEFIKS